MPPNIETPTKNHFSAPLFQITPLSKYLALALFVALPFIGGWIGYSLAIENSATSKSLVLPETKTALDVVNIPAKNELNVTPDLQQDIPEGYKIHTDNLNEISFIVPIDWTPVSAPEGGQPGVSSPEYIAIFNSSDSLRNPNGSAVFYDLYNIPEGFNSVDEYIGVHKGSVQATSIVLGGWQEIKTPQGYSIFVGKIINPDSSEYLSVIGKIDDRVLKLSFRNQSDDEAIALIKSIVINQ